MEFSPIKATSRREFRAQRYNSQNVFGKLKISAAVGGISVDIQNISMTGTCIRSRKTLDNNDLPDLVITDVSGELLLKRPIDIRWANTQGVVSDFGLQFEEYVDLDEVRKVSRKLNNRFIVSEDHNAYFHDLPASYKLLSIELLHHLSSLKSKSDKLENKYLNSSNPEKLELTHDIIRSTSQNFQDIWYRFNDLVLGIDRDTAEFQAMKWHTENVIRPYFMDAPVWKRSWDKPLGYPGDFRIMLYAYDSDKYVECPSLYDAVVHGYLAHTLGECIRGRMDLVIDSIDQRVGEVDTSQENQCTILNLGCGAARELPILCRSKNFQNKHLRIDLLDQDESALQYALELAIPAASAASKDIELTAINMPLMDVLRGRENANEGPLDAVYSLGLIDYLPMATAKRVARHFYDRLKPGGVMSWCNVSTNRETCYWPLEFITDWTLYYRDEAAMREMFDFPDADVNLCLERSNQIWVITAKKPL